MAILTVVYPPYKKLHRYNIPNSSDVRDLLSSKDPNHLSPDSNFSTTAINKSIRNESNTSPSTASKNITPFTISVVIILLMDRILSTVGVRNLLSVINSTAVAATDLIADRFLLLITIRIMNPVVEVPLEVCCTMSTLSPKCSHRLISTYTLTVELDRVDRLAVEAVALMPVLIL